MPTSLFKCIRRGLVLLLFVLALPSCSKSKPAKTYPVKGSVFINGEAAKGAIVTFMPANREQNPDHVPQGIVRDDGSFTIGTFEAGDGAPPGEYLVGIQWRGHETPKNSARKKTIHQDKLLGQFKPSASGIRVTVEAKENQLDPFQLKADLKQAAK